MLMLFSIAARLPCFVLLALLHSLQLWPLLEYSAILIEVIWLLLPFFPSKD